jgi:hypothetical protein
MRKRVNAMELIVKQARRDEDEPNVFKDKQVGCRLLKPRRKRKSRKSLSSSDRSNTLIRKNIS